MKKGIDVSKHQGTINWEEVKKDGIEFAIIRCGYGDNIASQDDSCFTKNISECERIGIPYGIYLYSYATTNEQMQSEIEHTLRLVKTCNPKYPVYLDLEANSQISKGKEWITNFAIKFCQAISEAGYKAGIYANQNWLTNYIDTSRLNDYEIWIANYGSNDGNLHTLNYTGQYQIHQYTSVGQVSGINGNVDMNICYYDYCTSTETNTNTSNTEQYTAGSYEVTADILRVRKEPNTSSTIVARLKCGSKQGVDYTQGNWGHLMNNAGWICLDYCKKIEIVEQYTAGSYEVTATTLNVRAGAGTNYKIVTTIKQGSKQGIDYTNGDWGHLMNNVGWIHLGYCKKI